MTGCSGATVQFHGRTAVSKQVAVVVASTQSSSAFKSWWPVFDDRLGRHGGRAASIADGEH